jgi:thiamine-phosphate pyrophosphorylase
MPPIARLHLITPNRTDRSLVDDTLRALEAGAPWVQVRTKDGTDRDRLALARELTLLCEARYATCVIDDRVDLAVAVDAGGVHLGADDLPVDVARSILGPEAIIGATCRNPDDARRAVDAGADYVGVGPVFETVTKVGLPDPIGLSGLHAVTAACEVPVIAISGITAARVPMVLEAGAHGVAVVNAVYGAPDITEAVARFLDELGVPTPRPTGPAPGPASEAKATP